MTEDSDRLVRVEVGPPAEGWTIHCLLTDVLLPTVVAAAGACVVFGIGRHVTDVVFWTAAVAGVCLESLPPSRKDPPCSTD